MKPTPEQIEAAKQALPAWAEDLNGSLEIILTAALALEPEPAVAVKPLEWDEFTTSDRRHFQCNTMLGQYQVGYLGEFECWQLYSPQKSTVWKECFTRFSSSDAAKAAAQADYEARIRSALVNAPAEPAVAVKPPFEFDRYINGTLMAEGVTIERQTTLEGAFREAARIASRGRNGEVPVLVLRSALVATPAPAVVQSRVTSEMFSALLAELRSGGRGAKIGLEKAIALMPSQPSASPADLKAGTLPKLDDGMHDMSLSALLKATREEAASDLKAENERLERERAEQWRVRREMEASRDMERAIAAALQQKLDKVTEALQSMATAYQKYLDASALYNERLAIAKTKFPGTMRVDEEMNAIDEAHRAFNALCVDIARAALQEVRS